MTPIQSLFEGHLNVSDLDRSIRFYRDRLGLELAASFVERRVAFFWIGGKGKAMLGLWESGTSPVQVISHVAFRVDLNDVLASPQRLREAGIAPLDFGGSPADEAVVLAWMPAAAVYFRDPDGNLLEYIAMLEDAQATPTAEVMRWSEWTTAERR